MGRQHSFAEELNDRLLANARDTVARANALLEHAGIDAAVTSGWRPNAINATIANASATSKHLSCQAIDLGDEDGALDAWCLANLKQLEALGLWLEHPDATPGWCHLQTVPPRSGNRVFRP